jgi:hypothetical protein
MKSESQERKTGGVGPRKAIGIKLVMALALVGVLAMTAVPVAAQDRIELSGFFGYVFSEGVSVDLAQLENINEVDFTDGMAYGGTINYWVNREVQLGFQLGIQDSGLDAVGTSRTEVTGMKIYNYHGIFTYNWGTSNSQFRPFFVFGLGATQYQPKDLPDYDFDGEVQFSGTLGGGVKTYLSDRVGLSLSGRWTPTYVKSDADGMYCSPYWNPWYPGGCVVLQDTDYSNQLEVTGGIILRF